MAKKRSADFVSRLNQLDEMVENKSLSKDDYLKERCSLFTEYFPDSPPDVSCENTEPD